MFWQFADDEWLRKQKDREWRAYVQTTMQIYDVSLDGKVTFSWHHLSCLLGLRNKNMTLFRILKKFHDEKKLVWENYEEFASRIPAEVRDRLEIGPQIGVSERGTIPKWKMSKGGVIREKVRVFSPQVIELRNVFRRRFRRKRKPFQHGLEPCPYHAECQFLRAVGEKDYCADGSLRMYSLREALESDDT